MVRRCHCLTPHALHHAAKETPLKGLAKATITREPGLIKFILAHNVSQGLLQAQAHFGLYIVAALLGPAAAGIYKIAEKFADILIKPASKFLVPAIYPDLAKAKDQDRRALVLKNSAIMGAIAITIFALLILFGKPLITAITGAGYIAAYTPMLWLCAAGVILTSAFAFEPLLSSSGRIRQMMATYAIGVTLDFALMFTLIPIYGITGAAVSLLISAIIMTALLYLFARDLIKKPK